MSFIELAKRRYSSRKYKKKAIEEEKLLQVLEAIHIAPSAANFQPCHFIVIRGEEGHKKIAECYHRSWFNEAPVIIVACGDHKQSWVRHDNKDYCDIDLAIAIDHLTLAATDAGLATCWICNFDVEKTKQVLNLPKNIEPIAFIPLAYPDDTAKPERHITKRKKLEDIIHWETF